MAEYLSSEELMRIIEERERQKRGKENIDSKVKRNTHRTECVSSKEDSMSKGTRRAEKSMRKYEESRGTQLDEFKKQREELMRLRKENMEKKELEVRKLKEDEHKLKELEKQKRDLEKCIVQMKEGSTIQNGNGKECVERKEVDRHEDSEDEEDHMLLIEEKEHIKQWVDEQPEEFEDRYENGTIEEVDTQLKWLEMKAEELERCEQKVRKPASYKDNVQPSETKDEVEYRSSDEEDQERMLTERVRLLEEKEMKMAEELKKMELKKAIEQRHIELEKLQKKEERRKQKEKRMQNLREKERSLQGSISDQVDKLSVLEEELKEQKTTKTMKKRPEPQTMHKPNVPKLNENQFEEWKMEVEVMLQSHLYNEDMLKQSVRNSLTGNMKKILLTIGKDATISEIIQKLESIYGNVRTGESVIEEFYNSRQKKGESISAWGVRLENLIQTAIEKRQIQEGQKEEMLKSRFWRNLQDDDLRNATRLSFETSRSFEQLRLKIRQEELEMKKTEEDYRPVDKTVDTVQQIKKREDNDSMLKELLEKMKRIEQKLEVLEQDQHKPHTESRHNEAYPEYQRGRQLQRGNWNPRYRGNYGSYNRRPYYRRRNAYDDRQYIPDQNETNDRDHKLEDKSNHLN